ncbi:MAG: RHS repeat protein, partial [Oxalobacteraceae bacterium]
MMSISKDSASHVFVVLGSSSAGFTLSGGVYSSDQKNGGTLTENSTSYVYVGADGTSINFDKALTNFSASYYGAVAGLATTVIAPSGFKTTLDYKRANYSFAGPVGNIVFYVDRLQSVRTSTGFQLKFTYGTDSLSQSSVNEWMRIANVRTINNAVDYCDPTADVCSGLTQNWPSVSFSAVASGTDTIESVTDPVGRVSKFVQNSAGKLTGVRRPSSPNNNNTTYSYDANGRVSRVAIADVGTWAYNFAAGTGTLTASVTTPTVPISRVVVTDTASLRTKTDQDENGRTTTYEWCPSGTLNCLPGLLSKATAPEGNYSTYTYDARGNRTSATAYPKPGSGLTPLTTSATYPASCTNVATCNKPVTTTETAGNVTNYFYNANGTLDYVQLPAPTSGAARPETHYTYWTGPAWYKVNSNSVTLAPDAMTQLLSTTTCITGSWPCATDKQKVTELQYVGGPSATNMQVGAVFTKRGDGADASSVSYGTDAVGNVTDVTDPLGRVTHIGYAADRQVLDVSTPSIDGTATGQKRATVLHYDGNGQVDSQTAARTDWNGANYTPLQYAFPNYDNAGRKISERLADAATPSVTYALKQWSYNGAGRLDCEVVRMNPATFTSAPAACTLGTQGSDGPDRITHYTYEYAGLLHETITGYGTTLQ